ncbi:MAG: 23S rRNA (pseudouridine(1915)-N(3))-methyltransferase RlmH [Hyphomicrobiales bacterium]|nr:23S rRNA (pseudouridine(1915)-N(3))-methyltransferase RlmH [Hyphomicrobiales bacterium]
MPRMTLIAVGRARRGPEQQLFEHYAARLAEPLAVREVSEKSGRSADERKRLEGEKLLAAVPKGARVVVLDERGKNLSSSDLADLLGAWRDGGVGDIAFLVGGADGVDRPVRDRADLVLSLGAMTWPHMMVRGMLAEQLFRAQCILGNHPYHRE